MRNVLKQNLGFTLVEVMITSLLLGLMVTGVVQLSNVIQASKNQVDSSLAVNNYKQALINALKGSDSFAKSAAGNTCLLNRTGCGTVSSPGWTTFPVLDNAGNQLTSPGIPSTFGFGKDLATCNTYPSAQCPFQYQVQWKMLCLNTSCNVPELKVRGLFSQYANGAILNSQRYNFNMILGQVIGNFAQACSSIGGNYIPGSPPTCQVPVGQPCGNGPLGPTRVTALDATTSPPTLSCQPVIWQTPTHCNPGQVMGGMYGDGRPICKNLTAPNGAPASCLSLTPPPGCQPNICEQTPSTPGCLPTAPTTIYLSDGADGADGGCGSDGSCGADGY